MGNPCKGDEGTSLMVKENRRFVLDYYQFYVKNIHFNVIGIWQLVYSAHVKWPGRPLQFIPMTAVTTLLFMKGSMRKSKLGFITWPRVLETPWDVQRGKVVRQLKILCLLTKL